MRALSNAMSMICHNIWMNSLTSYLLPTAYSAGFMIWRLTPKLSLDILSLEAFSILLNFTQCSICFEWEQNKLMYDYFYNPEPIVEEAEGTYTDGDTPIQHLEYSWTHALHEIITPLLQEGLQLKEFKEIDYSPLQLFSQYDRTCTR